MDGNIACCAAGFGDATLINVRLREPSVRLNNPLPPQRIPKRGKPNQGVHQPTLCPVYSSTNNISLMLGSDFVQARIENLKKDNRRKQ